MSEKVLTRDNQGGISERNVDSLITGLKPKSALATVGAGALTAAMLVSGLVMRTGPTGAYADTTGTATEILAAMGSPSVGDSFEFTIVNGVAFVNTFTAGAGVTLAGVTAIAASAVRRYRCTVTNTVTPAVLITGIGAMSA